MTVKASSAKSHLGPSGPAVDDANMAYYGSALAAGPSVHFDFDAPRVVRREPIVDISTGAARWKLRSSDVGKVGFSHVAGSALLHGVVMGGAVLVSVVADRGPLLPKETDDPIVEVSFGFDIPGQTASSTPARLGPSENDQQATKTEQLLPQVSKQVAVDTAPPAPDTLPPPPEEKAAEEKKQKETANAPDAKKEQAKPESKETPPPGVKKLTQEELARRMEREKRKVAQKEQAGTHDAPGEGRQPRPSDLPDSPFSNNTATASDKAVPAGVLDGSMASGPAAEYQAAAMNHMRRYWNLPDLSRFDPELKVEVGVMINQFGRIVKGPDVVKSSGDAEFDEAAVTAFKEAVPFPELPTELGATRRLRLNFSPGDVKN